MQFPFIVVKWKYKAPRAVHMRKIHSGKVLPVLITALVDKPKLDFLFKSRNNFVYLLVSTYVIFALYGAYSIRIPTWLGEEAYLTKRFQPMHQHEELIREMLLATFDQNKRIFLRTLPRTGFNIEVCSFRLSSLSWVPDARGRSAYDVVRSEGDAW